MLKYPTVWILGGAAAFLAAGPCRGQSAGGYDAWAWENWCRLAPGETAGLASSWDRTGGSFDANQYESPPGLIQDDRPVVAATLTGPGIIERFWMPHLAASRPFVLRMYFDGESTPRLSTTSAEILGGTMGYLSDPLVTTFAGGQVCYEPIPFRESVRIETENRAGLWHWYQYSYRKLPAGAEVTSWTGTLDPGAAAGRAAVAARLAAAGNHPAGESTTAQTVALGAVVVPAHALVPIASFTGGGVLRRITLKMPGAADAALDGLLLRVRYDGTPATAIEVPVSRFFGAGHGRAPYRSLPMGTDSPDGFYCFWPMPFRESVDVELFNTTASGIAVADATVENEPGPPAADAGYLHAETRSASRQIGTSWLQLAFAEGTAGQYVGNFLSVETPVDSFEFLEGDDLVIVDHADSLNGTGLEDAYNGGFYYNRVNPQPEPEGPSPPFAIRPLCGLLRIGHSVSPAAAYADQYRWMITDRVPFSEALEVKVETRYVSYLARWTSVVFWYQMPDVPTAAPAPGPVAGSVPGLDLVGPNPASSRCVVRFTMPAAGPARLELVDVGGRRVAVLREGPASAGEHEVAWTRGREADGVYFVRLVTERRVLTRKLILVRPGS